MTNRIIPLQRWTEIAKDALAEVASASLSAPLELGESHVYAEPGHWGSLVALVSDHNITCVGVSSTPEACRALAGAMLGMDASEAEELSHDDVRDSIGELANILAGMIKGRLIEEDAGLTLGLPLFIEGMVEGDRRSQGVHVACTVGTTPCLLTLLIGGDRRATASLADRVLANAAG